MVFANPVCNERNACPVLLAMPPGAACAYPAGKGLIVLGICERFSLAVIPSEAAECGQVAGKILLHIHTESVFTSDMPWMSGDIRNGCEPGLKVSDGLAINTHVGIVGVSQQTNYSGFFRN